jgi:CRP-like cAMP-binding protein
MDLQKILAQISLFDILTDEEKQVIIDSVSVEEYSSNHELVNQNSYKVNFIISGMIKVQVVDSNEQRRVIYVYNAGEFFVDIFSFLLNQPSNYRFVTVQPSTLMTMTKERMDFACDNFYNIQKCRGIWLENLCMKLTRDLEKFYFLTPEERYKDLLNRRPYLFRMLSNRDISSIIGIAPESFSRMIRRVVKGKKSTNKSRLHKK